jgi:hypothetical protein
MGKGRRTMTAFTSRIALQMNAVVAVLSLAAAAAMMSLVLTEPQTVAAIVAQHDYSAIAAAVARELGGWLQALLRFL